KGKRQKAVRTRVELSEQARTFLLPFSFCLLPLRHARRPLDVLGVLFVLLADVLHQLFVRSETCRETDGERLRVRARIVNRDFAHKRAQIFARPAFDRVQLLSVRVAAEIEPELVVEPDGVDDERVAIVPAYR